ncbi:MAG: response regulator transcription factor [Leptospiraceae bacterium]|nr:response regulator transcription factor [Leptospiraceae bacterium]
MALIRILTIDDEKQIRKLLKIGLEAEGFAVTDAATGSEGVDAVVKQKPDLVMLDLNLPDGYGLEVLKKIREFSDVPVIVLSVKDQEADKIALLEAGADDYITKPFGMGELLARIRAILRRNTVASLQPNFKSGALEINYAAREVLVAGTKIHVTPTEYNLLCLLAKNAGKVLTTQQIMREIWGPGLSGETGYLRVYITMLRKKIEAHPEEPMLLINEPAVGYRLVVQP